MTAAAEAVRLFGFEQPADAGAWRSIDDVVMGGRSSSGVVPVEGGGAAFVGEVSLENNGGFASVRSPDLPRGLSGFDGLRLRVRGDGRRYGLTVRVANVPAPLRYQAEFDTAPGQWQTVTVPFGALRGKIFGNTVPAPPLPARWAREIGFIISDGQAGPFRLEVEWIDAYRAQGGG